MKESDRIQVMADALQAIGVEATGVTDGIRIVGRERFAGGQIDSSGDHRLAMAMAIATLRAEMISSSATAAMSIPRFQDLRAPRAVSVWTLPANDGGACHLYRRAERRWQGHDKPGIGR